MKFDYGDEVVLRTKDGARGAVERLCAVVGITPIESERQAAHFGCPIGSVLYTVEFDDGTDTLVSEDDLRPGPR
jgi:hypothetical protein